MDLKEWKVSTAHSAQRHPWELARLRVVLDLLEKKVGKGTPRSVLDFGGGDLFVASGVEKHFPEWNIDAVDTAYTPEVVARLREDLGDCAVRSFSSLQEWESQTQRPVDVALLLDVLEHCEDDGAALDTLAKSRGVRSDCVWVITVPAFQKLFSLHDTFLGHHRRYTRRSLEKIVQARGLEVLESGYFFSSLLLPRAVTKFLEKVSASRTPPSGLAAPGMAVRFGNAIASFLFLDYGVGRFLRRFGISLPGLSCYVLAREKQRSGRA